MGSQENIGQVIDIIGRLKKAGVKVVVDTSGAALKECVEAGGLFLIKPNLEELCELLGHDVEDESAAVAVAGRLLLDKTKMVLVSRGQKGAVLVSGQAGYVCRAGIFFWRVFWADLKKQALWMRRLGGRSGRRLLKRQGMLKIEAGRKRRKSRWIFSGFDLLFGS